MTTDDTRLVADFVRRLRRVALHPLSLDQSGEGDQVPMPGNYLRTLMSAGGTATVSADHRATIRLPLPDEVQFESLATRVRTFTLPRDRLYWPKVFDALDRLTGQEDEQVRTFSEQFREGWAKATERNGPQERAYRMGYRVGDTDDAEEQHFTDIDAAYAWLYQDVAHSDEVSTGHFGVMERFRAAVGVFANLALVAVATLHYINSLVANGKLDLPVGTFSDRVVVTEREYVQEVYWFDTEVGADLSVLDNKIPEHLRPALDMAKRMMTRTEDPEGT
jgi:hypothetical protein